ncbi:exopolysaccharide biosynthesis polyprenyl glycosylphosphotransferase [Polaribacter cellanae]|uniref:Exopolysaccharide biosynthesis polyprenyl glycosylphosphotransferase n=1 Tax=Polaribacter cellanae TaxID=2818493 RepID=A0A975H8U7_9FLAO|nr:exopolysaccharide biosynthesis polyprenyl glycosylphosphotransferase [Polaribacter cellanae]
MKKRYSKFVNPLLSIIDLVIITLIVYLIGDKEYLNKSFLIYTCFFWFFSAKATRFYNINRNTRLFQLLVLLIYQTIIFTLGYFTYFGFFREGEIIYNQTKILFSILITIWFFKILTFYTIRLYRSKGNNFRNIVILGNDSSTKKIKEVLVKDKDLGYRYLGFFSNKLKSNKEYLGTIKDSYLYILNNEVDEIFCSLNEVNEIDIKKIKKFANKNNKILKLIPNSKEIYNKDLSAEFYGNSLLILNVKKLPLEISENRILKRFFDIIFSILVCLFIFSWLFPIIILLIRIESKGSSIFKQTREGINGEEFLCYKFRSMYKSNSLDNGHTKKNDNRITKVGSFLRKTSIDEFPQFINVLLGQMSIVGPRPHMNIHSLKFDKEVRNYMKRKSVKPGITGLAQISGYRGEIQKKSDIENRVRLDVFYIENWSFILDLKIITQTTLNIFRGDEQAY